MPIQAKQLVGPEEKVVAVDIAENILAMAQETKVADLESSIELLTHSIVLMSTEEMDIDDELRRAASTLRQRAFKAGSWDNQPNRSENMQKTD